MNINEIKKIALLKELIKGLHDFESMWDQAVSTLEENSQDLKKAA